MLQEFRIGDKQTDWKYLQRIDRIVGFQAGVVNEYTQHDAAARKRFMLARQRSMSLEKLGDKQHEVWEKEFIDLEQKIADVRPRNANGTSQ